MKIDDDRDAVLAAVRRGLPQAPRPPADDGGDDPLGDSPRLRRMNPAELGDYFTAKARAAAGTVDFVDSFAAAPALIARYLAARGDPLRAICAPALANLDWQAAAIAAETRPLNGDDNAGITGAFCAIAETGTLVLTSLAALETTASLLPPVHIAVIRRAQIVPDLEAALDQLAALKNQPANIAMISGPSRTADIEQTLVLGAHGPLAVHTIVVAE